MMHEHSHHSSMAPPDTSMKDQSTDKERRKFTSSLITAIEELELRRTNRSQQQLADDAWAKLQYDLPVVDVVELQALVEVFRSALWVC